MHFDIASAGHCHCLKRGPLASLKNQAGCWYLGQISNELYLQLWEETRLLLGSAHEILFLTDCMAGLTWLQCFTIASSLTGSPESLLHLRISMQSNVWWNPMKAELSRIMAVPSYPVKAGVSKWKLTITMMQWITCWFWMLVQFHNYTGCSLGNLG